MKAIGIHRGLWAAARAAATWPVHSQRVARRNAMVASTALTQRRREHLEVEEFLARHQRGVAGRSGLQRTG